MLFCYWCEMHVNQFLIIFVKKKDIVVLKSKALNNSLNEKKNERTSFIEIGFDHCVQSWDKTF